ncbi:MAG: hypothetical protein ACOX2V_04135 [Clostridia bacterium]|jgi:hypothetical protein
MKAKKWLTIITLFVATISLVLAYVIGKDNNSISYDITMALLGSAILGFIMSITEYYAERRKAMEEFYIQAIKVLQKLRKIKYLEVDAPLDLVIDAFYEEQNKRFQNFATLPEDKETHHKAKNNLISWYKKNIQFSSDKNTVDDKILEQHYETKMERYRKVFIQCMNSYQMASSVELAALDNAYGNLDFILANKCIRKEAYDAIYSKIRKIVSHFRSETYHFNLLKNNEGNFAVCAGKVYELNQVYFSSEEEEINGGTSILIFHNIFADINSSLEKFRCKIYGTKYDAPKNEPILSKMVFFGKDEA